MKNGTEKWSTYPSHWIHITVENIRIFPVKSRKKYTYMSFWNDCNKLQLNMKSIRESKSFSCSVLYYMKLPQFSR